MQSITPEQQNVIARIIKGDNVAKATIKNTIGLAKGNILIALAGKQNPFVNRNPKQPVRKVTPEERQAFRQWLLNGAPGDNVPPAASIFLLSDADITSAPATVVSMQERLNRRPPNDAVSADDEPMEEADPVGSRQIQTEASTVKACNAANSSSSGARVMETHSGDPNMPQPSTSEEQFLEQTQPLFDPDIYEINSMDIDEAERVSGKKRLGNAPESSAPTKKIILDQALIDALKEYGIEGAEQFSERLAELYTEKERDEIKKRLHEAVEQGQKAKEDYMDRLQARVQARIEQRDQERAATAEKRSSSRSAGGDPASKRVIIDLALIADLKEYGIQGAEQFSERLAELYSEKERESIRQRLQEAVEQGQKAKDDYIKNLQARVQERIQQREQERAATAEKRTQEKGAGGKIVKSKKLGSGDFPNETLSRSQAPTGTDKSGVASGSGMAGTSAQPPVTPLKKAARRRTAPEMQQDGNAQVHEVQHTTDANMPDAAGMPGGGENHEDYTSEEFKNKSLPEIKAEILRTYPPDRAWYILKKLGLDTGTHDLRTYGNLNTGLTGDDISSHAYILNNGRVGARPLNCYRRYNWTRSNDMIANFPIKPGTAQRITSKIQTYEEPSVNITPQYYRALGYSSGATRPLKHGRRSKVR